MQAQKVENLKENQDSLKTMAKRLTTPTPPFFKKLVYILGAIGTVALAITTLPLSLPAVVVTIASYGVAIGGMGAIVSKLAVDWKKLDENKTP